MINSDKTAYSLWTLAAFEPDGLWVYYGVWTHFHLWTYFGL